MRQPDDDYPDRALPRCNWCGEENTPMRLVSVRHGGPILECSAKDDAVARACARRELATADFIDRVSKNVTPPLFIILRPESAR